MPRRPLPAASLWRHRQSCLQYSNAPKTSRIWCVFSHFDQSMLISVHAQPRTPVLPTTMLALDSPEPPSPTKAFHRILNVPSPEKRLFRTISTNILMPATPNIQHNSSVLKVRDLVAPGVRPNPPSRLATLLAQVQANDSRESILRHVELSIPAERLENSQRAGNLVRV